MIFQQLEAYQYFVIGISRLILICSTRVRLIADFQHLRHFALPARIKRHMGHMAILHIRRPGILRREKIYRVRPARLIIRRQDRLEKLIRIALDDRAVNAVRRVVGKLRHEQQLRICPRLTLQARREPIFRDRQHLRE